MRRRRGTVSRRADGRWWARLPHTHGRRSLGVYDTREEAEAVLAAALEQLVEAPLEAPTLAAWGAGLARFYRLEDHQVFRLVVERARRRAEGSAA